jgi:hypothetical protein
MAARIRTGIFILPGHKLRDNLPGHFAGKVAALWALAGIDAIVAISQACADLATPPARR